MEALIFSDVFSVFFQTHFSFFPVATKLALMMSYLEDITFTWILLLDL